MRCFGDSTPSPFARRYWKESGWTRTAAANCARRNTRWGFESPSFRNGAQDCQPAWQVLGRGPRGVAAQQSECWFDMPAMKVRFLPTSRQGCSSTAECWSHIPAARVRLPPALPRLSRDRSSTGECWLGRPATRVRFPPVPRFIRRSSLGARLCVRRRHRGSRAMTRLSGPGYVWRRWLTVYEYLGGFDSLQGRHGSSARPRDTIFGLVFQRQDAVLARRRWGFESPRVHSLSHSCLRLWPTS